jgi:hypothetical protein
MRQDPDVPHGNEIKWKGWSNGTWAAIIAAISFGFPVIAACLGLC